MMKFPRQKWLLLLAVVLLLTNVITLAFYWSTKHKTEQHKPNDNNPADRQRRMGQFMVNELKLDKEQEAVYWKLRDTMVSQQKPLMDSIRNRKKSFFDLLKDPNPDNALIQSKSDEIAVLQKQLDIITFQHFQQVRALCKPEQTLKFDTVIKEIVNRMTGGWNKGRTGAPKDSTIKK